MLADERLEGGAGPADAAVGVRHLELEVAAGDAAQRARDGLLDALRRIPVDAQIVLELYYWEDLPAPDVARFLDVPEGTVRSRLRRALELLRERLESLAPGVPIGFSDEESFGAWARSLKPSTR